MTRAPSAWTVVLLTVALALVINLVTDLVDVSWHWWPVVCWAALLALIAGSIWLETRNRVSAVRDAAGGRLWHQVPPRLPSFTGRLVELGELSQTLADKSPDSVQIVVVHGMGGVGKSSLAAEFIHRQAKNIDLVWWITASERSMVVAGMAELASALGREAIDPEQAATAALRLLAADPRQWLLVFDGIFDSAELEHLLPSAGNGSVIITSRNPHWHQVGRTILIDVLAIDQAETLLQARTNQIGPGITELAERLGCLPIALDAAAQYCATTQTSVAAFAKRLDASLPPSMSQVLNLVCKDGLRHLATICPEAVDLLRLLSYLAPGEIPRELGSVAPTQLPDRLRHAIVADPSLGDLLYAARTVGLARIDAFGNPWLHELVQDAIRADTAQLGDIEERKWVLAAVRLLVASTTVDGDDHTYARWSWLSRLFRHGLASLRRCDDLGLDEPGVATLRLNLSLYLFDLGQRGQARAFREQVVASRRRLLDADDPDLAEALVAMSRCLRLDGQVKEAEQLSREAFEITERILGANHPLTLRAQDSLASSLFRLGKVSVARELRDDLVERSRAVLGDRDPWYWVVVNHLAHIMRIQGEIDRALSLRRSAYNAMLDLLGEDHPRTQTIKNDLAFTLWDRGDLTEAHQLMADAYARRSRLLGKDNVSTTVSLSNLALILRDQGNYEQAMQINLEVFHWRMRVLGRDDLTTLISMAHLARSYMLVGHYAKAKEYYDDVYQSRIRILGPEANSTLQAATDLANLLIEIGHYQDAAELHEETLRIRLGCRDSRDRGVAASRHGLGRALMALGEFAKARSNLQQAYAVRSDLLGETHKDTTSTKLLLATVPTILRAK